MLYDLAGDPNQFERFGFAVGAMGDLDGDGVEDFAVGSPYFEDTATGYRVGRAQIFSGRDGSLIREHREAVLWAVALGWSFARIGDANRDGVADYAIGDPGAWSADEHCNGTECGGAVWIYSGRDGELLTYLSGHGGFFGESIAEVGDVDGDGVSDLAVGASLELDPSKVDTGAVSLWTLDDLYTMAVHRTLDPHEWDDLVTVFAGQPGGAMLLLDRKSVV